jgi:hypothetical protein
MPPTTTTAELNKGLSTRSVKVSTTITDKPRRIIPDFDAFAASHPWIGQKIGGIQNWPGGFAQQFQAAVVYGVWGGDPFEVHDAIGEKYKQLQGPMGLLGFPITNETPTPDGVGRFNHFESGSIYWHPAIGAFEIHGAIRDKWASEGRESFGYPLTDESSTPDGVGRFNHFRAFQSGGSSTDRSIYWTPAIGAQDVRDGIRTTWANLGWELSFLGYPVSGEYDSGLGRRSDFERGSIVWTPTLGLQVQPQKLVVDAPNITFETGIAVGGSGRLEVFSDGTTHFHGHLHDSGIPPFDCLAVFALKDSDGHSYAASTTGTVHGWDPGSRNFDWDDWGMNNEIRRNWAKLWSSSSGGYRVEITSDWTIGRIAEMAGKIGGAIEGAIAVGAGFIVLFGGGGGAKKADPNYGPPEAYPPGGMPPPEAGIKTV